MINFLLTISLFIIGALLGTWFFSVIVLPLFYGIPKTLYWYKKGYLKIQGILFYCKKFLSWTIIFIILGIVISFLPNIRIFLYNNEFFFIGQWVGIIGSLIYACTKKGRKDLNQDFWDTMIPKYMDIRTKFAKEILAVTLTKIFVAKYGNSAEQKVEEFLNDLEKHKNKKL